MGIRIAVMGFLRFVLMQLPAAYHEISDSLNRSRVFRFLSFFGWTWLVQPPTTGVRIALQTDQVNSSHDEEAYS
jgi:hypothetical protein